MKLLIMRHGQAEHGGGYPDAQRPLTPVGAAELVGVAKGLCSLGVSVELIAHSPFVRTAQTAKIVGAGLGAIPQLLEVPALASGARPEVIHDEICGLAEFKSVMVVGHAPDVSLMCRYAVSNEVGRLASFWPGSVACINYDGDVVAGSGKWVWLKSAAELCEHGEG